MAVVPLGVGRITPKQGETMLRTVQERRSEPGRRTPRVLIAVVALGVLLVGAANLGHLLPSFPNPFGTKTVDRSQPALLQALEDLSEYRAASGNFQVIVDLEKDAKFMPAFIRGQRTLFVGAGSVDAIVDFAGLDQRAISVSDDRR
jgi:hypothetical protein